MKSAIVKKAVIKMKLKNLPADLGPLLNLGKNFKVLLAKPNCAKGAKMIAMEKMALKSPNSAG